ncbi:MAG: serine/threonine-protein kinase [Myxococcota bacterium]
MAEASQRFTPEPSGSNYRPVCELAAGGMGRVDLAIRQEGQFQRLYAVKRLKPAFRDDVEFISMLMDEARIAGFLRHPNVVSVLDVGEDDQGPYTVMDYVDGVSVQTFIRGAAETEREIPLQLCLRILIDASRGLHAAHELKDPKGDPLGLVHRDVSPQNILLGYDGTARVTDFGVAKAFGRMTHTATGVLKGKFGYMAPELLQYDEPDRRSDLFSLGIVAFELMTGRRLYKNTEGMDGVRRILKEPPPDLADFRDDCPPELVQLMFSLLAKQRDHRPKTALAAAHALEDILAELVQLEGRTEMVPFLEELFAKRRAAQREHIAQALAAQGREPTVEVMLGSHLETSFAPARPSWGRLGLAAAALVAVTAGITWFAVSTTGSSQEAEARGTSMPSTDLVEVSEVAEVTDTSGAEVSGAEAPEVAEVTEPPEVETERRVAETPRMVVRTRPNRDRNSGMRGPRIIREFMGMMN